MNFRVVLTLALLQAVIGVVAIAQERPTQIPNRVGLRVNRGEPGSFLNRWWDFDSQLDIWKMGVEYPKDMHPDTRQKLQECVQQRKESQRKNEQPLLAFKLSSIDLKGLPPEISEKVYGKAPETLPSDSEREKMFVDYCKAEIEAESLMCEQIFELLKPSELSIFLGKPARLDAFLIHPMGELYLNLSSAQKTAIPKQYQIRKSLTDARVRSPQQLEANRKALEDVKPGTRTINIQMPAETLEEFTARMYLFALLESEQLVQFLRLNQSIKPDQQITDWIDTLKGERRTIAYEVLLQSQNN